MTAPIDTAQDALLLALAEALVAADFLSATSQLLFEPSSGWEPEGAEGEVMTAAAVFGIDLEVSRELMGGSTRRFVLDRTLQLELIALGPVNGDAATHKQRLDAVLDAVAPLSEADPTLGQTCERLTLTSAEDDEVDPDGLRRRILFTIRLRAGDRLGRTAP